MERRNGVLNGMMSMFNMFNMMGNYEDRKVGRYDDETGEIMVSTAEVMDAPYPYETAVAHPQYNNGKIVIVASYDCLDAAKKGHARWVEVMTASDLPDELVDVSDIGLTSMMDDLDEDDWRVMKRTGV